ncbi:MAG TPA: hypothetical protein VGK25_01610, partial [Ignavibacteria bacterium]
KNKLCDWIQQGPNWALFNTFPRDSKAVMYGTYKITLKDKNETELYNAIYNADRRSIKKSINNNVVIKKGVDCLNDCLTIINGTAIEADLQLLTLTEINLLLLYLKDNLKIYVSYKDNVPQTASIFLGNIYSTFAYYAGSTNRAFRGSNVYLYWKAIVDAKNNNCDYFDFVGARINPDPGSKIERIQRFKEHFGSELVKGYLWKMNISVIKYHIYSALIRLWFFLKRKKYDGDIIDQEIKRLEL